MSCNETIYIGIDTNLLYKSTKNGCDFSKFKMNKTYQTLEKTIERYGLSDNVKILLPTIVLSELKKQQIDKYQEKLELIQNVARDFMGIPDFALNVPNIKYEELISAEIESFSKNKFVKIIDMPLDTEVFGQIIDRAIQKRAPFCGAQNNSDKGFKDVLVWESIVAFAKENPGRYLYLSKNQKDFPENLSTEFFNRTMSVIDIFYKEEECFSKLLELNDNVQKSQYDFVINELENGEYIEDTYIEIKNDYKKLKYEADEYEVSAYVLKSARENLHEVENGVFHFDMILEASLIGEDDEFISKSVAFLISAEVKSEKLQCQIIEYSILD